MTDHAPLPEEPKTPMWLPALGAALFLLIGIWWAATQQDPPHAPPPAPPVASASAAAAAPAK